MWTTIAYRSEHGHSECEIRGVKMLKYIWKSAQCRLSIYQMQIIDLRMNGFVEKNWGYFQGFDDGRRK